MMTTRRPDLLRLMALFLPVSLLAAALLGGIVRAAPRQNPTQSDIVISEVRARGVGGEYDEFVELFNPSGYAIDIGGWVLRASSGCGSTTTDLVTISAPRSLAPGQHYLLASSSATSLTADQTWTADAEHTIANNGGVALFDPARPGAVDSVGMCATTLYVEGEALPILEGNTNRSFERLPGGSGGNCSDSDNNGDDFRLINPSQPQNAASALTNACNPPTPSPTASDTPTVDPANIILISEFRTRGLNGEDDEVVELYNPGANTVRLDGWKVRRSSGCGVVSSTLFSIPEDTWLPPGGHFLAASEDASISVLPDAVFGEGLFDNGGLALLDALDRVVDQVGMCADTLYHEGNSLLPLEDDLNQTYERLLGGVSGSCLDSGDNLADFWLLATSEPQNLDSPTVVCGGVATSTPTMTPTITPTATISIPTGTFTRTSTYTRTMTRTRTPTPFPTALPGNVVINEYLPRPASDWDSSGEVNSRDEYIELMNMGATDINLRGWKLDDMADSGSSPYTLPDLVVPPYGIVRYYASQTGISLSDGGDSVRLLKPDGRTADSHNYSVVMASDQTWCRLPDGSGAWAFACRPTPGRPNAVRGTEPDGTEDERPPQRSDCLLPDTSPPAFRLAECEPGGGTWRQSVPRQLWLEKRWKWDIFVE